MILNDIRDIAKVVLGSGLPDNLYKEDCPIHEKMASVASVLDITPRQVVMLTVAIHIGSRSVNKRTIARFCETTEDNIESYKWDLLALCLKGYLHVSNVYTSHIVYCIPFGLLECWEKGKAFHTSIIPPSDAKYNRMLFADQVYNNFLKPYWMGKATIFSQCIRRKLEGILYEFSNYTLGRHLHMSCQEEFCPSPSLGMNILLLVISNTLHPVEGKFLGKDEVRAILFGDKPTEPEQAEYHCTLDFLLKTNKLDWDGRSLKLAGIFYDWVTGDLDLDLIVPYERL